MTTTGKSKQLNESNKKSATTVKNKKTNQNDKGLTTSGKPVVVGENEQDSKEKTREVYTFGVSMLTEEDKAINSYLEDIQYSGMKIGRYIKNLIKQDMKKSQENSIADVNKKLDTVLSVLNSSDLSRLLDKAAIHEYMIKEVLSKLGGGIVTSFQTQPQMQMESQQFQNNQNQVVEEKDDILKLNDKVNHMDFDEMPKGIGDDNDDLYDELEDEEENNA